MRMKSVMKHDFSRVPQVKRPRSSFDRSFGYKTTFNAGYLIPFFVDFKLPGDTDNVNATIFARFATMLFPIMDNMFLETFFFFVPNRLVWEHWEQFCGARIPNPDSSISYVLPTITSTNTTDFNENTIYDYMGLATKKTGVAVQSLPLRCYNLIYNTYFRDQNLQNGVVENLDDGPDAISDYSLLRRGKRHDYFTSCLPFPQKGNAVSLPLGTTAPVLYTHNNTNAWNVRLASTGASYTPGALTGVAVQTTSFLVNDGGTGLQLDPSANLYTDLSNATAATINAFRLAMQTQVFLERDAIGGTRYTESIEAHFGVTNPDFRLQRPEYLGGGSAMLNVSSVPQTSNTPASGTPQGNLAAFGTVVSTRNGYVKSFSEHGFVIGLVCVRADLTYQQGTERFWYDSTRFDLYWPEFANIGEQAVLMREIYTQGTSDDLNVWGYQEAWAHYRYKPSKITGLFRTNATGTLDSWHLSQDLSTPALNSTFIVENPPTTRVKATSTDPDFIMDSYIKYVSARVMPLYGQPFSMTRL